MVIVQDAQGSGPSDGGGRGPQHAGAHEEHRSDGVLRARGAVVDGVPDGYWEWYRRDGSLMRSGWFAAGEVVGDWVAYDRRGRVRRTTHRSPAG